eukprot:TRINITY_DN3058_c0_g1_i1.p1 TRINITY_DN3058_c0_g1~~TRINITY_DN3058_c0_g1_i1.p1  ORF type:complete len:1171 (+),score=294.12 TRINITY_DN3058_c0_g1_i1:364-3513(+)
MRSIEAEVQARWEKEKIFETDAPADPTQPKFFCTFPYPYMNGQLHIGHSFSLSKTEFASGYQRMKGKNVLFPFAFHCTGMPILACADRLKREIEIYGCPPDFDKEIVNEYEEEIAASGAARDNVPKDKAKSKKTKAASKVGSESRQWNILKKLGIPEAEIPRFADAKHWLLYFPPIAVEDLKAFGLHTDWRRSFITTDVNPFYDSFIRWHFDKLIALNKLAYGKRNTVYSPFDGQPCADHDRATGEGVGPQEYTAIKLRVVEPWPAALAPLKGREVFCVAATLRPETMYGQTNCWILPEGEYGAFEMKNKDVFIMSDHAARNFSYQEMTEKQGDIPKLLTVTGAELVGCPLKAPRAQFEVVYMLPLLTISMVKGTGIVTSVPSDSPDDFAALNDWKQKEAFREKYSVKAEWVLPFEPVPIIDVPELGDLAAPKVCADMKIKSQNDREALAKAKELVYTKDFYEGVLKVGEHAGKRVQDAKPLIKAEMIASGQAVAYAEPEQLVMSRSGDECVVCLTDQWFLAYGEQQWQAETRKHLESMDTFTEETKSQMHIALDCIHQWPCSRSYGLGTKLPSDPQFLIDSLSDSTIYMAFYTVAHLLQGGVIDGSVVGPAGIRAEQLTDAVWDYIFLEGKYPADCGIEQYVLDKCRQEFNYWYPMDLRVSGKDLIQNHLIFWLYNHVAIFPKSKLPLGVRANGHLLLNSEKMSKSTGNFLTLREGVEKYSADAMRFTLADAGDGMEDANFQHDTANKAILRLTGQLAWIEEIISGEIKLRSGPPATFADRVFASAINRAIRDSDAAYERMMFREALKTGFYDLQTARDNYRAACVDTEMNKELIMRFIWVQALILKPICPHMAEHWWKLLGHTTSILREQYPIAGPVDEVLARANEFLQDALHEGRVKLNAYLNPKKGRKEDVVQPKTAQFYVAKAYPEWQQKILTTLSALYEQNGNEFPPEKTIATTLSTVPELKPYGKKIMPFVIVVKTGVSEKGKQAFQVMSEFDEMQVLRDNLAYLTDAMGLQVVLNYADEEDPSQPKAVANAAPGKLVYAFV